MFTGKEHWIVATESVSSSGTFWARVVRTSKEEASFVDDMERMGLVLLLALYFLCDCSLLLPRRRKFTERDGQPKG